MEKIISDLEEIMKDGSCNLDPHTAASVGDLDHLMTLEFDMDFRNLHEWTPLMYAAYYDHRDVVNFLITRGAKASGMKNSKGRTALMMAAMCG